MLGEYGHDFFSVGYISMRVSCSHVIILQKTDLMYANFGHMSWMKTMEVIFAPVSFSIHCVAVIS